MHTLAILYCMSVYRFVILGCTHRALCIPAFSVHTLSSALQHLWLLALLLSLSPQTVFSNQSAVRSSTDASPTGRYEHSPKVNVWLLMHVLVLFIHANYYQGTAFNCAFKFISLNIVYILQDTFIAILLLQRVKLLVVMGFFPHSWFPGTCCSDNYWIIVVASSWCKLCGSSSSQLSRSKCMAYSSWLHTVY